MMSGANIPIPGCCEEARRIWKLEELLNDLAKAKRKLRLTNEGLTENEMSILCVLLGEKGPKLIAAKLGQTEGAVKTALSTGLYDYIECLNGSRPRIWIDAIKILGELGYHNTSSNPLPKRLTALLVLTVSEVSESQIEEILKFLRDKTGDSSLMLMRTEKGSVVLVLEGSQEGCNRLLQLFESGELTEILGIPLQEVQVVVEVQIVVASSQAAAPSSPVDLSQWLENNFAQAVEAGWQALAEVFASRVPSLAFRGAAARAKQVQVGSDAVVLRVDMEQAGEEIRVILGVYPAGSQPILSQNLKVKVVQSGATLVELEAKDSPAGIVQEFFYSPAEQFSVELMLDDAIVTENFTL